MTRRFTFGPESSIELSAGFLWAILAFVASVCVGGTIWCTTMYLKIEALEKNSDLKSEQISKIEDRITSIDVNVTKLLYIVDPPVSRPVLIGANRSKQQQANP